MKKYLLMAVSIVLVAALAIAGTVAYLTDTDEEINVMTIGNVQIDLIEQQRNEDGTALEDFEQNKLLMPIVGSAQGEKDSFGMPVAKNYVDKIVSVENTGANDAYVRVIVAVPAALEESITSAATNALHWNLGNKYIPEGENAVPATQYSWKGVETVEIDGVDYNLYVFTYGGILAAGDTTTAAFVGFYLDSKVDFDGTNYTLGDTVINYDFSNGIKIPVYAQAVQASGFDTADEAFTASGLPTNPWA